MQIVSFKGTLGIHVLYMYQIMQIIRLPPGNMSCEKIMHTWYHLDQGFICPVGDK